MTGLSITQIDLISKPYTVRQSEATSLSILLRQIWHLLPKAIRFVPKHKKKTHSRETDRQHQLLPRQLTGQINRCP